MNRKCKTCQGEIEEGYNFCENCWEFTPKTEEGGNEGRDEASLYFPSSDYSSDGKKGYEMKEIHPSGKNSTKYRWFICSPKFPEEQYKINDPHCHAWPNDRNGEVRVSLDPSSHEPTEFKVKWGKIKGTDQTEIKKLVRDNKELIYQEWQKEWIRQ